VEVGLWLLARLWAHDTYNRRIPKNRQAPLWGFALNELDRVEVLRLEAELVMMRHGGPTAVR
jgi:hypothetical protein